MCRRVCLLRERGETKAAGDLHDGPLHALATALRAPEESDAALAQRVAATLAVEAERVANAAVLAELLAPLLGEMRTPLAAAPRMPSSPPSVANSSPARVPPADIADFIDEMIAQERSPRRAERRAS